MKKIFMFILAFMIVLSPCFQPKAIAANSNSYPAEAVWSELNGRRLEGSSEYTNYLNSIVGKRFSTSNRCQAFVYQAVYNCFGKGNLKTAKYCCATAACGSYRVSTSDTDIPIGAAVYFSGSGTKCSTCGQNAGHVAIYIGNGEIIHCASVKIDGEKYKGFIRKDPITLVTKTWGYRYQGWGWQGGFEIPQQAKQEAVIIAQTTTEPELNMLSQNMLVNVGKGYTLRLCSTVNHNKAYAIGSIPNEATIYVYGITKQQYDDRTWAKVNYNGTDGWANYEHLTPVPSTSTTVATPTPTMQIREYSITFDANGGTGIMVETVMTAGVAKQLPANAFKRPQYKFAGWATSPNGSVVYADQQTVDLSSTGGVGIGLYAAWEPELQPSEVPVLSITEYNSPSKIDQGSNFGIRGIVQTSVGVITEIKGYILDGTGNVIQSSRKTPNETSHNLRYSINNDLVFGKLTAGDYIYRVAATAVNGDQTATQTLIDSTFTVLGDRVETSPTSMPDQTIVKPTAPWISVSTNEVMIDRAAGDSAYVSVTYGGDMPNGCYLNMAAAGPFICEWIDDQSFVINAFDTGAADLDVLLCEEITDVVVAKQTIHVEVVDNTQASGTTVQQAPASPPDLPGYRLATKLDTDFVLDVVGHGTSNGDNVQLSKNNSTDSQGFVITDAGAGYRTIMNYNSGLYLTADGSGASGSNVYQWEYTGKDTQLWQFIEDEDGSYLIVSKASGCYLDVDNAWANDGTNVKMFDRNGGYDAQNWYIQAAYLK